ncbi:MAG TPA: AfsR/SARP family transcriptional regulator, partial [Candidatus Dormibacteraeota bacterium]|nr:AfsR/SARP family transcriptional regulator [Candidatus Dormibacteraeota bacterium]
MSDFAILGRVLARQGDRLLPLAEPKTRAVLAALLINPNHVVSANRLIALVWGPNPPMSALNTLQVQISKLRRCLGESARERYALETRPPGYMIRIASDSIDAGQFLALSESARSAVKAGDHGAALDSLDSALALWRGAALEDVDLPFAAAERERLEGLRLDVLEDRFEALTSVGREGEALEALERTAAMHPLRERLQGQLMIALYRCGRQAEASAVYQRTRERLVEEMGMEPGPQLQGILRGILKQEVSVLTPAVTSAKRSNLPIARTRFVGRASQVLEIAQMVRDGPLLTLLGAGGIGKTRLG